MLKNDRLVKSLPPWGGSGLKCSNQLHKTFFKTSPSLGREWIEIACRRTPRGRRIRLPPWGGSGLKCRLLLYVSARLLRLPPWGGSGLKFYMTYPPRRYVRLPPWGGSGLKCSDRGGRLQGFRLPPWGGSGLKSFLQLPAICVILVSLLGEGVD